MAGSELPRVGKRPVAKSGDLVWVLTFPARKQLDKGLSVLVRISLGFCQDRRMAGQ